MDMRRWRVGNGGFGADDFFRIERDRWGKVWLGELLVTFDV